MKRILPIILVLAMLLLVLLSCGPKEEPVTTTEEITTTTKKITTTSKQLNMGIADKDEGWSFWKEF